MKILLDECLPKRLKRELPEHEVYTVPEMGWAGTKNGALIRAAIPEFDVFLTVDQNLTYQQNLTGSTLAIVTLNVLSNRFEDIVPLMPRVNAVLKSIQPGEIVRVKAE